MTGSASPVRIGMVGAGYIAGVHSAAYRTVSGTFPGTVPRVELRRVADRDADRARALASAWEWDAHSVDWQEVTRADDVDLVDICTPNDMHAQIAIDALRHGKHVVCEKPLAADPGEAREMAEAARASGRLAQVCFYYRTWPAVAEARRLVESGAIGTLVHLRGWMLQDYAADPSAQLGWRASAGAGGAGALADLGSHIVDVARFLGGDIAAVQGMCRSLVDRGEVQLIDAASALVQFDSGASGSIEASWSLRGHSCDLGFDLVGDEGAVRFSWERANELQVRAAGRSGFERILVGPGMPGADGFVGVPGQQMGYRDAFTLGLAGMLSAIAGGDAAVSPSFEDGHQAAQVVAAIERASASGLTSHVT